MQEYCVYMHILKEDRRIYFGKAKYKVVKKTGLLSRWGKEGNGYKHGNSYFKNALEYYGWDAFDHIIISTGLNHDAAVFLEECLIEEFNTTNKKYGFNLLEKGNSTIKHGGRKPTYSKEEAKQRTRERNKRWRKEHPLSESQREENKKHRRECYKMNHPVAKNKKQVRQKSTGLIFESGREASIYLGKNRSYISTLITKNKNKNIDWEYI